MSYKQLTIDDFKKAIADFYAPATEERQFVVQTGLGGMMMINNAIKKEVEEQEYKRRVNAASFEVSKLKVAGDITFQEWENLKKMCHSVDRENLTVVEAIIEHYEQRRVPAKKTILPTSKNEKT